MSFQSWARWPNTVSVGNTLNESTDEHTTQEAAEGVVALLKREGFGGERKVFPIAAGVRPLPSKN
jgi:hypothetical protein